VTQVCKQLLEPGTREIIWEINAEGGQRITEGIYFFTIETDEVFIRDKIIVGR
jgi:hypothetical protein